MISKKYWFLGVYLLFSIDAEAQKGQKSEQVKAYNLWLSESSVGTLFEVEKIEEIDGVSELILKNRPAFGNAKRMALTWPYLEQQYEQSGLSIYGELFKAWSRVSMKAAEGLSIRIICDNENIFQIRVFLENDVLQEKADFAYERETGVKAYEDVKAVYFSNPNACLVLKLTNEALPEKLIPILNQYFSGQNTIDRYYDFEDVSNQDGSVSVHVKGLKGVMTSRFFEQLELRFSWARISDEMVKLCYSLSGEYSSGVYQPGDFEDMNRDFIPELMSYSEILKKMIIKSLTK